MRPDEEVSSRGQQRHCSCHGGCSVGSIGDTCIAGVEVLEEVVVIESRGGVIKWHSTRDSRDGWHCPEIDVVATVALSHLLLLVVVIAR